MMSITFQRPSSPNENTGEAATSAIDYDDELSSFEPVFKFNVGSSTQYRLPVPEIATEDHSCHGKIIIPYLRVCINSNANSYS